MRGVERERWRLGDVARGAETVRRAWKSFCVSEGSRDNFAELITTLPRWKYLLYKKKRFNILYYKKKRFNIFKYYAHDSFL